MIENRVARRFRALTLIALLLALAASAHAAPQYGWLGVRIRDLSEQEMEEISKRHGIREGFGVYIVEVINDTPAARAGIKPGDIVVAFEGRPVTEGRMLQRLIAAASVEGDVRVTVLRPAGRRQIALRLAAMPLPIAGERVAADFGFILREPGTANAPTDGAPTVAAVLPGSPAERAGLKVDDVVVEVSDRVVLTRDAAREALADASPDRPLALVVRREGARVALTLRPR